MLECQLVREFVRRAEEDRGVEGGVQRGATAQQPGVACLVGLRVNLPVFLCCGAHAPLVTEQNFYRDAGNYSNDKNNHPSRQ
jgi:hypothetical protein